jgi:thiamine biosynthesis lipoprotein
MAMTDELTGALGRNVDRRGFLKALGILGAGAVAGGALQSAFHVVGIGPRRLQAERTLLRMGSFVTITAVHDSRDQAEAAIGSAIEEMDRLIALLSRHEAASPLAALNRTGELRDVPAELATVLRASLDMHRTSEGAFDITVQPVLDLYENGVMPSEGAIREAMTHVGARHVVLDGGVARLRDPRTRLTLDGIAPGFIADRVSDALARHGVASHLVNVSGDIRVRGRRADGRPWHVAVEDPEKHGHYPDTIELCSGAVSTSGSYEIYYDREKLHHHIIDPATGASPTLGASVSVIAGTSMRADALSTAAFVMTPERAREWIDGLPGTECLVIGRDGGFHRSSGWSEFAVQA